MMYKAYSKSSLISPAKIDRRAITRTTFLGCFRLEMTRTDSSHMLTNVRHSNSKRSFHTVLEFLQLQTARFCFLDVPVKAARDFTQSQRLARRQRVNRQLQPA